MLIKSEDEEMQKRYIVKKNDAGEYQPYDTFYKKFVGGAFARFSESKQRLQKSK